MQILFPDVSIAEKILRPALVYAFLLIAFRIAGKRELGEFTPFDLIVLLTISNVLQNAMIGPDNSLGGGLIGAGTVFVVNGVIARLAYRFPRLGAWIQGEPTTLIDNGEILHDNMRHELMTLEELQRSLRRHDLGWEDITRIRRARLESDGTLTIQLRHETA